MPGYILIIDDERGIREAAAGILEDEYYTARGAADAAEAREAMQGATPDLVILDVWLQGSDRDGLEILADIKTAHPDLPVVMVSGHGTIDTAVTAIKRGAYDFIEKPFAADRLLLVVRRALEAAALRRENAVLRRAAEGPSEITGQAPATQALRALVTRVAQAGARVLITGEAGTGKSVLARLLHAGGPHPDGPFVTLGCAGTDAQALSGALAEAAGGTLLLNAVGEMPAPAQGALVQMLQDGGQARVMATTTRPLEGEDAFRQDLYYRLAVVPVAVPPLRARVEDIAPLAAAFVSEIAATEGLPARPLTPAAVAALEAHAWPGNVRQLRNAVEWAMIFHAASAAGGLRPQHLPPEITGRVQAGPCAPAGDLMALPLREARERFERDYLTAQMGRFGGSITRTARFIGMERSALHRKVKALGLGPGAADEAEKAA
ncbi:MAG: sigma-54-dependent Fis family transcriptional regulator [Alphaproteobacteria bacterium]|jgi:two-component system nitrogen regulation response regulator NtrX|nr:sigma-54-dependent Fis family transcriptional regulator [Alphaproteobacteria bacterium]